MKNIWILSICSIIACSLATAEETKPLIIEISKPMRGGRGLGTMAYRPTEQEAQYVNKITEKGINLETEETMKKLPGMSDEMWEKLLEGYKKESKGKIPIKEYKLIDQAGEYVGWFGIVREVSHDNKSKHTRMLIEHKYFDGLTDLHLQVVSIYGAGDFAVQFSNKVENVLPLSLVRVFGKVSKGKDNIPEIAPEYVRVWDWGLFTFMDYSIDKSNPKWVKLRTVSGERVYSSRPTKKYYEDRLGKRDSSRKASDDK